MADITIVRSELAPLTEAEAAALLRAYEGLTEQDKGRWRRFVHKLKRMQPGQLHTLVHRNERDRPTHNGWMKIEAELFDMQEVFRHRAVLRDWIKIGSGFVEWHPDADGVMSPIPKRLTFEECDDDEFMTFVAGALAFMETEHFGAYLWRHLQPAQRSGMVKVLLEEYEQFLERFHDV